MPKRPSGKRTRSTSAACSSRRLAWLVIGLVSLVLLAPAQAQTTLPALPAAEIVDAEVSTIDSPGLVPGSPIAPVPGIPAAPAMPTGAPQGMGNFLNGGPEVWTSPEGLSSALQVMLLLTVLSMAPAVLLMTTCFIRIVVVLGLLRQALGTQQLPPSQVMTSLALFMTLLIMGPVWKDVYENAIVPYTDPDTPMSIETAWEKGSEPVRDFMARQIDAAGNSDDIWLFYDYLETEGPEPESYDEVPLSALVPAFMLSELKTAFLIGFQIYLPFLILDIVIASITISMGMLMLPPVMISLPFKLMLFVLVDGWHLVVGMLLESFMM